MTRRARFFPLFCGLWMLPVAVHAAGSGCSAAGGKTVPSVLELYTSEGCDSCPPIDRWFSRLKPDADRGRVVPLAFHVDYWDYIGWKDRFAEARYGARHREAARRGGARVVYTPQVFLDGQEFRPWRRTTDKLPAGAAKPARAELRIAAALTTVSVSPPKLQVEIGGKTTQASLKAEAYVALFENGLTTDVKAGENKGVTLHHDFVVRRWLGPFAFERGQLNLAQDIDLPADGVLARSGIAVVALDERGAVLQAVALPLRDCAG